MYYIIKILALLIFKYFRLIFNLLVIVYIRKMYFEEPNIPVDIFFLLSIPLVFFFPTDCDEYLFTLTRDNIKKTIFETK